LTFSGTAPNLVRTRLLLACKDDPCPKVQLSRRPVQSVGLKYSHLSAHGDREPRRCGKTLGWAGGFSAWVPPSAGRLTRPVHRRNWSSASTTRLGTMARFRRHELSDCRLLLFPQDRRRRTASWIMVRTTP